jgi:methyltransferase-like protein
MYHETLSLEKICQELRKHNNKTTLLLDYKNILKNHFHALPTAGSARTADCSKYDESIQTPILK